MRFKTILVHLDGRPRGAETLRIAVRIAQRFESHLAATFSARPPPRFAPVIESSTGIAQQDHQGRAEPAMKSQARAQVSSAEAAHDLRIDWRCAETDACGDVAMQARLADLLVMTQEEAGFPAGTGAHSPAAIILRAGRPVLLLPCSGPVAGCGESVLIAWNGGREAARATGDAMPFLEAARAVHVLSFVADGDAGPGTFPSSDVGLWLAHHGVRVTLHQRRRADPDVGGTLLAAAIELGSDLLVMGAYGHSRAYELVLGGTTRSVLREMNLPVFMAH